MAYPGMGLSRRERFSTGWRANLVDATITFLIIFGMLNLFPWNNEVLGFWMNIAAFLVSIFRRVIIGILP